MQEEIRAWLEDIERSIAEIYQFLPEKRDFFEFKRDLKTRKAVERNIEIIGEAMNRILKKMPDVAITNAQKIIGTRNRIIHEYDAVSEEILWLIIVKYLPILETEAQELKKRLTQ